MIRDSAMIHDRIMIRLCLLAVVMILILGQATSLPMNYDPSQGQGETSRRGASGPLSPSRREPGYGQEVPVTSPPFRDDYTDQSEKVVPGLTTPTHSRQSSPVSRQNSAGLATGADALGNVGWNPDALVSQLEKLQLRQRDHDPHYPEDENESPEQDESKPPQGGSKTKKGWGGFITSKKGRRH